jgi:class 3 adenylate cyclase
VNLLARLVKVGAPGEVVVTEGVAHQLPSGIWDLRPLQPVELRGIAEPVSAIVVERRLPAR